ncbi:hypothetical protein LCGC14_1880570 [marine sediment metagenome]|uniref:Uncharacterized protein n=1 Tax=marine sediment metagenome TaxID=412755 RepID=A0A0F9G2H1_9ZZZZ
MKINKLEEGMKQADKDIESKVTSEPNVVSGISYVQLDDSRLEIYSAGEKSTYELSNGSKDSHSDGSWSDYWSDGPGWQDSWGDWGK